MSARSYGPEEKTKLEKIIAEGASIHQEIDDLKDGLRETVKAVAAELELKPAVINKAIQIARKGSWETHQEDWEEIEAILSITKRI